MIDRRRDINMVSLFHVFGLFIENDLKASRILPFKLASHCTKSAARLRYLFKHGVADRRRTI